MACFALTLLMVMAARSQPVASAAKVAPLTRDAARCSSRGDIDTCYDAIRRSPDDPVLLVALGDALIRARRPEDAIRNYRRALQLAPAMRGVAGKITAAEANLSARRSTGNRPERPMADSGSGTGKRFSNAAAEPHSH